MTNQKSTKKAFISSVLSLILCLSMLVGTTFAWFTDSVTSTGNIIKSGKLDATLEYKEDYAATTWTDASTKAIFDYDKWEPGYVDAKYVKVANVGNLAFKYFLSIIPNSVISAGETNLADVIDVYVFEKGVEISRDLVNSSTPVGTLSDLMNDPDGAAYGILLPEEGSTDVTLAEEDKALVATGSVELGIALKMQESAGNEYQNKSVGGGFSVQLLASQYTWENDSFDHTYDANAEAYIADETVSIINNSGKLGETVVLTAMTTFGEMTVTVPAGAQLSSNETDTLRLTIKNAEPFLRNAIDESRQGAFAYEVYLEGISDYTNTYINGNTGGTMYNYEEITVSIPIVAGRKDVVAYCNATDMSMSTPYRNKLNYDAETGLLTFEAYYFNSTSYKDGNNFTFVYAKTNEAENKVNELISQLGTNGGTVSVVSNGTQTVLLDNIADTLSGTSNVSLVGNGADNTTVQVQGAKIEADSLTLKDMTIETFGLAIAGDNTTIDAINSVSYMTDYPVEISGSNTTIKNSTFLSTGNTTLMIANNSDTADSVTTIDGCTIESYYTLDENGEKEYFPFGNLGGLRFQNFNGTLNVTNTTIITRGSALNMGPNNSTTRGIFNISDSKVDSTTVSISTVKSATLKNVTFDNTWSDSAITFYIGGQKNVFDGCEFKSNIAFNSTNWGNKTVAIEFNDCTYEGTAITAENILTYFDFSSLIARDPKTTVTVNGTAVTLQ